MTAVATGGRARGRENAAPHLRELDWLMLVTVALCCLVLFKVR